MLTPAEQEAAINAIPEYERQLAETKRDVLPSGQRYLAEKLWLGIKAKGPPGAARPDDPATTTPFGGFFTDPFQVAEEQTGSMYYLGARYNFNKDKTKVGLEWNHGSQYWFNFAPAQDDLIAPKTNTRGTVWEGYVTHRITRKFVVKLAYITYDYDYSGSGWHLGAPKDLETAQILGFPTYKTAHKLSLGFSARF